MFSELCFGGGEQEKEFFYCCIIGGMELEKGRVLKCRGAGVTEGSKRK